VNGIKEAPRRLEVAGQVLKDLPNLAKLEAGSRSRPTRKVGGHIKGDREGPSESELKSWEVLWKKHRDLDKAKVEDYREDIDTLLVFAGPFSAVVTAFIIAFHVVLQPSWDDIWALILLHTTSLNNFSVSGSFNNPTAPAFSLPAFELPPNAVRFNIFWTLSLAVALLAASFGMLVGEAVAPRIHGDGRYAGWPALTSLPLLLRIRVPSPVTCIRHRVVSPVAPSSSCHSLLSRSQ